MAAPDSSRLTLIEAIVLGLLVQQPRHGFALAKELGPQGWLGGTFTARRPVVYRALRTLAGKGLVVAGPAEATSAGPDRVVMRPSAAGQSAFSRWVSAPVSHMRDVRVDFLVKLALHDRLNLDPSALLRDQYELLEPIYKSLQRDMIPTEPGFPRTLAMWRAESSESVMRFLERLMRS